MSVGGSAGAVTRALVSESTAHGGAHWPWATFSVNVVGALILGFVITRVQIAPPVTRDRMEHLGRLIGTGFCGALTTFSTMQLELLNMLDARAWMLAAAYATASIAAGLAGVALASNLARRGREDERGQA